MAKNTMKFKMILEKIGIKRLTKLTDSNKYTSRSFLMINSKSKLMFYAIVKNFSNDDLLFLISQTILFLAESFHTNNITNCISNNNACVHFYIYFNVKNFHRSCNKYISKKIFE